MRPDCSLRSPRRRAIVAMIGTGLVMALTAPQAMAQCQTNQNCWPPPGGCAYPAPGAVFYPGTPGPHGVRNAYLHDPNACAPMPGGSPVNSFFDIFVELDLTTNGGASWTTYTLGLRPCGVQLNPPVPVPPDLHFDTEMLAMSLSGGGMPVMIRESPTLASYGGTNQRDLGGGNYRIDSFFDVFTELSLDGGQSWFPTSDQMHLTTVDQSPTRAHEGTWGSVKILYR